MRFNDTFKYNEIGWNIDTVIIFITTIYVGRKST